MQRHQEKWGRMVNILDRDGVDKRTAEKFYVAVVQAVFLFGLETCVVTPRLEKSMGTERQLKGKWIYPTIDTELATMGIEEIRVYIARHKNTVSQYIVTRTIMDLCLAAERSLGMWLWRRWWEQFALYILGIRISHAASEIRDEMGTDDLEGERY